MMSSLVIKNTVLLLSCSWPTVFERICNFLFAYSIVFQVGSFWMHLLYPCIKLLHKRTCTIAHRGQLRFLALSKQSQWFWGHSSLTQSQKQWSPSYLFSVPSNEMDFGIVEGLVFFRYSRKGQ
jgi:hypothetical protein